MQIFSKRPLAFLCTLTLIGFALFSVLPCVARIVSVVAAGLFLFVFLFLKSKVRGFAMFSVVLVLCSFLLSYLYFDLWFDASKRYDGREVSVIGTVMDVSYTESYGGQFTLRTDSVSDSPFSSYRFLALTDFDVTQVEIGGTVRATGTVRALTDHFSDEEAAYRKSKGYSAVLCEFSSFEYTPAASFSFFAFLSSFRRTCAQFLASIEGQDSRGFLPALLIGERSMLSPAVRSDFSLLGISHLLAVSGMHLAILTLFLSFLLRMARCNRKVIVTVRCFFCLFYVFLSGLSPSVLRAAIMLTLSDLLYLLSSPSDPLTSLALSVSLIVMSAPYEIYDVSLLLSAFATLGVLSFSEFSETGRKKAFVVRMFSPLLVAFFAVGCTFLLQGIRFGTLSPAGLIASPVFGLVIEVFMFLGVISIPLSFIFPVGVLLSPLERLIGDAVAFSADKTPIIYSSFTAVTIVLVLFSVLFGVFLIAPIRRRKAAIVLLFLSFCSVFAVSGICTARHRSALVPTYAMSGTDEFLLLSSPSDDSVVCLSDLSSADCAFLLQKLKTDKMLELEALVLTDVRSYTVKNAARLCSSVRIRTLYLPNTKEADNQAAVALFAPYRVSVSFYSSQDAVTFSAFDFSLLAIDGSSAAFSLSASGTHTVYLGRGCAKKDGMPAIRDSLSYADTVIFGVHGKAQSGSLPLNVQSPNLRRIIHSAPVSDFTRSYMNTNRVPGLTVETPDQDIQFFPLLTR